MGLQLPGDEVGEGDPQLLLLGVAHQFQDLHAVPQGGRNGVQQVGGGDEHHFGEIKTHVQVMVGKGVILFRVQHLQEGRGGVAVEIGADLVHFIQNEHRVVGAGPAHALDDAAGQGPHVGAAVPPDLGFVPHPPQGEAHELAPQGAGNGAPQGGLAGPRRPHETEDRTLHVRLQPAHRQIFQDALLHLLQVIVVFIQDLPGLG